MIVKKIKAQPRATRGKTARVTALIDYIDAPQNRRREEKCVYAGARNHLCETRAGQQTEMIALAQEAVASKDPIQHWVLSWREDEQPTTAQVEAAVDLFLDGLGMRAHQALYALHADTDDLHLHLVVNRVHPDTLKVIKPNGGFDLEAAHRAIARIEHVQGWEREPNGRYRVSAVGELVREPRRREPGPGSKAGDLEARTGTTSAERIAREEGAPILRRATEWADLHLRLAARGLRLEPQGRGAVLWVGGVAVKASRAGRECGWGALYQRLGAYLPAESVFPPDE
ncbi:MAG: relaxase/mobilization nuclease domain-containing protein, partial [Candidatus Contendobacter sp.]